MPFTCQGNENGLVIGGGALDTVQTQGAWPLKRAFDRVATGIDADATGTASLAGLLQLARDGHLAPGEEVAVIFSGIRRSVRLPATRPPNQATTSPPGQERSTS